MKKWNYETHTYDDYAGFPKSKCYAEEMSEIVQCAQCGKELLFGETFTSLEVHTDMGFGYGVCENCHQQEVRRKLQNRAERS